MKGRRQRPAAGDVRGVMAELTDLVDDLDLRPAEPQAAPAPPERRPEPADLRGEPQFVAVPMWETAEPPPAALWETFSPHLSESPPRPWSPAAAMAVVEPADPPFGHRIAAPETRDRRPHLFTIVTAVAVLVAVLVFVFTRLDLGSTSGPARAVSQVGFSVTGLRTVSARSAQSVAGAPAQQRFLSSVPAIFLDVTYQNPSPSEAVRIVVQLLPAQQGTGATTVSDETHAALDRGGEIVVTLVAPPGGFAPGTYTVRALHDGHLDQTWSFQVIQG